MKKIAIIGHGYVGQAVSNFFEDHFDLTIVDPKYFSNDNEGFEQVKKYANECEFAVICVPTPMNDDGSVDLSYIEDTFSWLEVKNILIKSTIPPGTTDILQEKFPDRLIAFSPEYIGEGKYVVQWWKDQGYPHPTDMKYHDFQIFGGAKEATGVALQYFKKVLGPGAKYFQTTARTAELCKYMENAWGGVKVIFCNEFAKMAEAMGVDYDELRELWLLDGRVERMHTAVFQDKRGFGGKCFPKDINGIVKRSEQVGYEPRLLKTALEVNKDFQKENESLSD